MWGNIRGVLASLLFIATTLMAPALAANASDPSLPVECQVDGAITGTSGDDVLTGTAGDDVICGLDGNDQVDGLGGNDLILGGIGNDSLVGGYGNDTLLGGAGDDTENGGIGDDEVGGDDGTDMLYGGPGADNLFGGNGPDSLLGGDGNDGLRGDDGVDSLQGDSGVNICERDSNDTVAGCFYDSKGPNLVAASVDPLTSNIHALDDNVRIHARLLVNDPGTGIDTADIAFMWVGAHKDGLTHGVEELNASLSALNDCSTLSASSSLTGMCLYKGNMNRAVIDVYIAVPKNTKAGKWELAQFSATDRIFNRSTITRVSMRQKRLNVNFRQMDTAVDISGPKITPLGVIGSSLQESSSDYVRIRVRSQDPSGISSITVGPWAILSPSFGGNIDVNTPTCSETTPAATLCVESANLTDTIIQIPIQYQNTGTNPDYWTKGKKKICYCDISASDTLGNSGGTTVTPSSSKGKLLSFTKDYVNPSNSDDRDRTAPKFTSISSNVTSVDTGTANQTVTLHVGVQDSGAGLNLSQFGDLRFILRGPSADSGEIYCYATSVVSGDLHAAVFELNCIVPAHYSRGKIRISEVHLADASMRGNMFDSTRINDGLAKMPKSFRNFAIVNG